MGEDVHAAGEEEDGDEHVAEVLARHVVGLSDHQHEEHEHERPEGLPRQVQQQSAPARLLPVEVRHHSEEPVR